uniref:Putative secreted protein n=1 Tax=Ixodes ricinus TaxID=34613 RepID=A0A147BVS1_IXORI
MATLSSVCLPFIALSLSWRPSPRRSRIFLRSLSILSLTIKTLDGWIPTGNEAPLAFSRWMRSMWTRNFLRYTWTTLPTCWLNLMSANTSHQAHHTKPNFTFVVCLLRCGNTGLCCR